MGIDRRGFISSVAAAVLASSAGTQRVSGATGSDWALGPYDRKRRRNNPEGAGLPDGLSNVKEVWKTDTVPTSTPIVVGGTVYFGSDDGVHALDARSGNELWSYGTQGSVEETPAVYDGSLYAGTDEGRFISLDVRTGEERWQTGIGDAVTTSPMPKGVDVFVGTQSRLVSLDVSDGSEKWSVDTRVDTEMGPAVTEEKVIYADGSLVFGLNRFSGEQLWRSYVGGVMSEVAVEGTRVYALGGSTVHAQRIRNGVDRWSQALRGEIVGGPVIRNGKMHVSTDSGFLYSLGLSSDGWTQWKKELDGVIVGSPVAVDGVLYAATRNGDEGRLYAVNPSSGEILGEYVVGQEMVEQDGDGEVDGVIVDLIEGPTVGEGNAYLVTESGLRAFGGDSSRAPDASFNVSPSNPSVGEIVTFDGSPSSSGDAPIDLFNWTVRSDGNVTESSGESTERVFETPGEREITLAVTDENGLSDTATQKVSVAGDGSGIGTESNEGGAGSEDGEGESRGRIEERDNRSREEVEEDGVLPAVLNDGKQRALLALGSLGAIVSALGFSAYWRMEPESERLRKRKEREEGHAERGETKGENQGTKETICLGCGESVEEGDRYCPNCGSELSRDN